MLFTKKFQRCMTLLKALSREEYKTIDTVSKETGMSVSYLEVLCKELKSMELVETAKGPRGGYKKRVDISPLNLALLFVDAPDREFFTALTVTPNKKDNQDSSYL